MAKKKYQIWWTDDRGNRIFQIGEWAFLNYTRIVNGIGTANIGLPLAAYKTTDFFIGADFKTDYRIEIWRTPKLGEKRRMENVFFMQEGVIRTREDDGVTILDMTGHDPLGQLKRRINKFRSGTAQSRKTGAVDDVMKEIVDEQMGAAALADDADRAIPYNAGIFRIQNDATLGATITKSFAFRNVLDVLKELHQMSQINAPKIYFDVVAITPTLFEFQTFQNQRGADRRQSARKSMFLFSIDRGNLEAPSYEFDSFDEKNVVYVGGKGEGALRDRVERSTARETSSVWGRREVFRDARAENLGDTNALNAIGDEELGFRRPKQRFVANFLDTKSSIYGLDWDFGNLHTANYAGLQFDAEIKIVYVTVEDDGSEKIYGRNEFGEFGG